MSEMRQRRVRCISSAGFHEMAYTEWGDPANPRVLLCVHGLLRCGRDFDDLARAMSDRYRVVCPDVVGRGQSDWLKDKRLYAIPQYCADMTTLIARLDVDTVHWVGTSMGGLIGMSLAAQEGTPLTRLVLNDVGPVVAAAAIARIGEYVGVPIRFDTLDQAEAYVRVIAAPFGRLTDAQWRHITLHVVKQADDGKIDFRRDPGIAEPFRMQAEAMQGKDLELWPVYDAIRCPTLVLRGETSDTLSRETVAAMRARGPRAQAIEIAGVGHAPMLMDAAQIASVGEFLLAE